LSERNSHSNVSRPHKISQSQLKCVQEYCTAIQISASGAKDHFMLYGSSLMHAVVVANVARTLLEQERSATPRDTQSKGWVMNASSAVLHKGMKHIICAAVSIFQHSASSEFSSPSPSSCHSSSWASCQNAS